MNIAFLVYISLGLEEIYYFFLSIALYLCNNRYWPISFFSYDILSDFDLRLYWPSEEFVEFFKKVFKDCYYFFLYTFDRIDWRKHLSMEVSF